MATQPKRRSQHERLLAESNSLIAWMSDKKSWLQRQSDLWRVQHVLAMMHSNKQSALVDPREIILAKLSVEQLMSHLSTLQNGGSLPAELFVDVPESAYEYIPVLPRVVTDQQIFQLPPSAAEALHGLNQSRSSDPMNRDQSGKNRSTREANSDALVLSIIPALADVTKFRDHEQTKTKQDLYSQACQEEETRTSQRRQIKLERDKLRFEEAERLRKIQYEAFKADKLRLRALRAEQDEAKRIIRQQKLERKEAERAERERLRAEQRAAGILLSSSEDSDTSDDDSPQKSKIHKRRKVETIAPVVVPLPAVARQRPNLPGARSRAVDTASESQTEHAQHDLSVRAAFQTAIALFPSLEDVPESFRRFVPESECSKQSDAVDFKPADAVASAPVECRSVTVESIFAHEFGLSGPSFDSAVQHHVQSSNTESNDQSESNSNSSAASQASLPPKRTFRRLPSIHSGGYSLRATAFRKSSLNVHGHGNDCETNRYEVDSQNSLNADMSTEADDVLHLRAEPTPIHMFPERLQSLSTLGDGLVVKQSTIPNGGRGVFADRPFRKGEFITEYQGTLITMDQADELRNSGEHFYICSIGDGHAIDGIKEAVPGDYLGSMINDGILPENNNCKFIKYWNPKLHRNHKVIMAIRPIEKGDELLISYGKQYWDLVNVFRRKQ